MARTLDIIEGYGFAAGHTSMFNDFDRKGDICIEYIEAPVFFMLSQRREAIEIVHIGVDGRMGKLGIRNATKALMSYIPLCYPWCQMLLAPISMKTLYNMSKKVGFIDCGLMGNEAGTINMMAVNYG